MEIELKNRAETGLHLGANYLGDDVCEFVVWAPRHEYLGLVLERRPELVIPMESESNGYYRARAPNIAPGTRYWYLLSGNQRRPDPASRSQPDGVHGPSEIVDPSFPWTDQTWINRPLADQILYELHVGTFSPEGTFDAVAARLPYLRSLGVTTIELMPVAQFPGARNWGYDGVSPYAVQNSYGGPTALKRLVDAAHREGLAVALDVVYNHLGPEGNYLREFGPYFTSRHKTPWGDALNFEGPDSDEVRRFFIENALYWVGEFHIDVLRLDAIHAIVDPSARPFVQQLTRAVQETARSLGREAHVIAESDLNDIRVIEPESSGGFGCDAQWSDDFHHALHVSVTGERSGYYQDFQSVTHLAQAFSQGFVYTGQYSTYRRRSHGNSPQGIPPERFVVCAQNHDQVGNRAYGERLSRLVGFESLKLAAGVVLLSPYLPLIFMGEEYGETAPFLYFTSHGDPALIEAVRNGRKAEFAEFSWSAEPPDPQDENTFLRSRLTPRSSWNTEQRLLADFYGELIRLRRESRALAHPAPGRCESMPLAEHILLVRRWYEESDAILLFHFADQAAALTAPLPPGQWTLQIHSADGSWGGPGNVPATLSMPSEQPMILSPWSFVVYERHKS